MTHALHRQGTSENLKDDFTLLMLPAVGINDRGSGPNRWRLLDMVLRHNGVFAGQANIGNLAMFSREELLDRVKKCFEAQDAGGMSPCMCCGSRQDVVEVLKEVVAADMGLSIIVQGILEDVISCLKQVGLKPHSVHHSLGVWGKTDKLPGREILEITTMCGHGLVSAGLVKLCIQDILKGKKTAAEAARVLSKPCICGIFNTRRAEMLLGRIAAAAI